MSKIDELMNERINAGREYRNTASIEIRSAEEGVEAEKIVEGYASTFNEPYTLFDFGDYCVREQIDAHAFDECDMSDVIMQYDHNGRVFARMSNKTLDVRADEHGLKMVADLGGTEIGRQLYEEIKGGYTNKMSFGFIVAEDKREVVEDYENNRTEVLRTITKIQKLFDVSRGSFMPSPNVDSAVIRLDIRENPPIEISDEKFFFRFIKAAFAQRRKTASNSLSAGLSLSKETVNKAIAEAGFNPSVRPESLTMEELGILSETLYNIISE